MRAQVGAPALVLALVLVAVALGAPRAAAADEPSPAWLVSLPLLGLERGALAVQGERYRDERWVFTASLAGRRVDAGDFDARGLAAGGGARWFFRPFARWGRGGGAFVAGRLDGTWRWLVDESDGRTLGHSGQVAVSVLVGWRLVAWKHFELTPDLGLALAREWTSAGLAADTTVAPVFGLSAGYLW